MPTAKQALTKQRRSRGRPRLEAGIETIPVTIRMTPPQKLKLVRLGGPQWVRDRIDKAHEPDE